MRSRGMFEPEFLESRRLLDGAIEIWGGNTQLSNPSDNLSPEAHGYVKLGETNAANATTAIGNGTAYNYLVIVSRARVQLDAVRGSDSTYLNAFLGSQNVDAPGNITGAPNSGYAILGTQEGFDGTYASYFLFANTAHWTSVALTTGSISPLVGIDFGAKVDYLDGASSAYAYVFRAEVRDSGWLQNVRMRTPAGQWYSFEHQSESGRQASFELLDGSSYNTAAALNTVYGDGTYRFEFRTPIGTTTADISYTMSNLAIAAPQIANINSGATGVSTTFTLQWQAWPANVAYVDARVSNWSDAEPISGWYNGGETSAGTATLNSGANYVAEVEFTNSTSGSAGAGIYYQTKKAVSTEAFFRTAGTAGTAPDITVQNGQYNPGPYGAGSSFVFGFNVANNGTSNAVASSSGQPVPLIAQARLSKDHTLGNADDITILAGNISGLIGGMYGSAQMQAILPSGMSAGSYYLAVVMDIGNRITESNETNNTWWSTSADIKVTTSTAVPLSVLGGMQSDDMRIWLEGSTYFTSVNGVMQWFTSTLVSSITMIGNAGDDLLKVGPGVGGALLRGEDGNDTIIGGAGNDTIYGNLGDDSLLGGDGVDSIMAGLGVDRLDGGAMNDSLYAGDGTDVVYGGTGNDYIEGRGKADTIYGGAGNDTIYGGAGADSILGEDGDDWLYSGLSTVFHDTLNGGAGSDHHESDSDDILQSVELVI